MIQIIRDYHKLKRFPVFAKKLRTLLSAGFDLKKSIDIVLADESDSHYKKSLEEFRDGIISGKRLTEGLKIMLPSGTPFRFENITILPNIDLFLAEIESYYQHKIKMMQRLISSLTYPIILLGMTMSCLIVFLVFLLPMSANFFVSLNMDPPKIVSIILAVVAFFSDHFLAILLLLLILFVGLSKPLSQLFQKIVSFLFFPVRISDTLWVISILLENGIDMRQSLNSVDRFDSKRLTTCFLAFKTSFLAGQSFTDSLSQNFSLTSFQKEQLLNSEKTPLFKVVLKDTAKEMFDVEQQKTQRALALVQPVLLLALGALISLFLYFTFLPLIGSINSIT